MNAHKLRNKFFMVCTGKETENMFMMPIDTGNKAIKTENFEFNSGITMLADVPGENEEALMYQGRYYRLSHERNVYLPDKTMDEKLTAMLGLPEEMGFPNRADIRKDAERCISQKAEEMLSASWQDFLYQSGCDTKSLLPMVRRSEIRERAERYYLQNGSLADIHFIPQISLEASFSDAIYLLFLEYGEQAAEKIARQWIKRNIPYISQQRILYGCVRDEFREILDTPNDRIHKIKHLIQALNETRHKAVQVILCRKKKVIQVNMSVEELCNPKGYYSIRGCSQKDRATLERMFGKTAEFRIEDIQSVSYGGIVLYENVASRNAA